MNMHVAGLFSLERMSNFSDLFIFKSVLFIVLIFTISFNSCTGTGTSINEILFEIGSDITLPCNISYPYIHWYKNGNPIKFTPNGNIYLEDSRSLVITNAKPSDSGTYKCLDPGMEDDFSVHVYVQDCGFIPDQEVIENGQDAIKTNHPWNAGIYLYEKPNYTHFCGGTLITPIIVISAAHCVKQDGTLLNKDEIFVGLGKGYIHYNDSKDLQSAQLKRVTEIIISEHYDGVTVTYYSDIVLFELKTPAKLTRFVQLACIDMANRFQLASQSIGTVVGWGKISKEGEQPDLLQKGYFPFVNKSQCENYLEGQNSTNNIAQDKFCSGNFTGESGKEAFTRPGDSGSGIIFKFNKKNYLFGVVSTVIFEHNVCLFTNVTFTGNLEFIQKVLQYIRKKHKVHKGYNILPRNEDILANTYTEIKPVQTYMPSMPNLLNYKGKIEEPNAKIVTELTDFQAGDDILIPCHVTGNPTPVITWFKYGKQINNTSRVRILKNINRFLLIMDADLNDSGLYKCHAEITLNSGTSDSYNLQKAFSSSEIYISVRPSTYIKAPFKFGKTKSLNEKITSDNGFDSQMPTYISSQDASHMNNQRLDYTNSQKPNYVNSQMPSNAENQMSSYVNSQMPSYVNSQMPSYVNGQMPSNINNQMPRYVNSQMPSYVNSQMPSYVNHQMPSNVKNHMPSYVNSHMPSYLYSKMPSYVNSQWPSYLNSQKPSYINSLRAGYMNQKPSYEISQMPKYINRDIPFQMDTIESQIDNYQNEKVSSYTNMQTPNYMNSLSYTKS